MRALIVFCLLSVILTPAGVHAEDGEMDRQERFINFLLEHPPSHFTTTGGHDYGSMGRLLDREFDGRIADLVPAALAHDSTLVRRGAIRAIAASRDPEAFPILVDLFLDPEESSRSLASSAMDHFFDNLPLESFLSEDLAERLGQYCLDALANPESAPDHPTAYIGLLGRMKYSPAEPTVLQYAQDAIKEGDRVVIHSAVVALSRMGSSHFEELVLSDRTRKALQSRSGSRDIGWFNLLQYTMAYSERVKSVVKDIVFSEDHGRREGYDLRPESVVIPRALYALGELGDDDSLDVIWGYVKDKQNEEQRRHAAQRIMRLPRNIIRSPQEKQALLETVMEFDQIKQRLRDANLNRVEEGTIIHWLIGPDSPLDLTDPGADDEAPPES